MKGNGCCLMTLRCVCLRRTTSCEPVLLRRAAHQPLTCCSTEGCLNLDTEIDRPYRKLSSQAKDRWSFCNTSNSARHTVAATFTLKLKWLFSQGKLNLQQPHGGIKALPPSHPLMCRYSKQKRPVGVKVCCVCFFWTLGMIGCVFLFFWSFFNVDFVLFVFYKMAKHVELKLNQVKMLKTDFPPPGRSSLYSVRIWKCPHVIFSVYQKSFYPEAFLINWSLVLWGFLYRNLYNLAVYLKPQTDVIYTVKPTDSQKLI